jgi:hypothetical protein
MNTSQAICRMREVIRRQHKALATEDCYIFWLRRYMTALREMPEGLSSEKKLEQFLTDLARHRDVSASTQNQALNAILFFYREVLGQPIGNVNALRAKRPVHARHAPTVGETQLLLQTIRNEGGCPTNLIARMLYGCFMYGRFRASQFAPRTGAERSSRGSLHAPCRKTSGTQHFLESAPYLPRELTTQLPQSQYVTQSTAGTRRACTVPSPSMHRAAMRTQSQITNLVSR